MKTSVGVRPVRDRQESAPAAGKPDWLRSGVRGQPGNPDDHRPANGGRGFIGGRGGLGTRGGRGGRGGMGGFGVRGDLIGRDGSCAGTSWSPDSVTSPRHSADRAPEGVGAVGIPRVAVEVRVTAASL